MSKDPLPNRSQAKVMVSTLVALCGAIVHPGLRPTGLGRGTLVVSANF